MNLHAPSVTDVNPTWNITKTPQNPLFTQHETANPMWNNGLLVFRQLGFPNLTRHETHLTWNNLIFLQLQQHCEQLMSLEGVSIEGTSNSLCQSWFMLLGFQIVRPFSPFFCLFCPFPEGAKTTWKSQKRRKKAFLLRYLRICLNSAPGKWGRTQMGSDEFNRILTGF